MNIEEIKMIAWNMGGSYTEHGQRCAACELPTGVYFVDLDRGLDYFFPSCPLDSSVIKYRYQKNMGEYLPREYFNHDAPYALRNHLEHAAKSIA